MSLLSGVCAPNQTPISDRALSVILVGRFTTCKLMSYHTPEDIRRVRSVAPKMHFLMRLPDEVRADGTIMAWGEYAGLAIRTIKDGLCEGVTDFQLGNEPNLTFPLGWHYAWQWFWGKVVDAIRTEIRDPRLRLGIAPMAWNPGTWAVVERDWLPAMRLLYPRVDALCCNSYWQATRHITDRGFGGGADFWHAQLGGGKPVWVTEWGSSVGHQTPQPSPGEIEARMVSEYALWLSWARSQAYIEMAHCFSLDPTIDWSVFTITPPIAKAMAA